VFEIDPGSARLAPKTTDSPTESGLAFFKAGSATNQYIAAAEVMLIGGHNGTKQMSTIACRLGRFHLAPSAGQGGYTQKFLVQFIAPQAREGG